MLYVKYEFIYILCKMFEFVVNTNISRKEIELEDVIMAEKYSKSYE